MLKTFSLLGAVLVVGVMASGCAGPEKKLGRGLNNTFEIVRGGEFRRSMEQTALFDSPNVGYTTGAVKGFHRTLARTGLGLYEVITAPFPPYDAKPSGYLATKPVYPASYQPRLIESTTFATDESIGFSGGDIVPYIPGSRFRIFDN